MRFGVIQVEFSYEKRLLTVKYWSSRVVSTVQGKYLNKRAYINLCISNRVQIRYFY